MTFWTAPSVQKGAAALKEGSPYRFMAESGIEATTKHEGLLGSIDMNTWVSMSIQRAIDNIQARTQDGLAFLATVGSTAPFVGLFGTVWGIMNSFFQIGMQQNSSLAVVAPGISEALFATAIGLFAAIPAVIAYNRFSHRVNSYEAHLRRFADQVHAQVGRELERS